jgi:hypothetical protein
LSTGIGFIRAKEYASSKARRRIKYLIYLSLKTAELVFEISGL